MAKQAKIPNAIAQCAIVVTVIGFLVVAPASRLLAGNEEHAKAVVERAIEAHGGADVVTKYRGGWHRTESLSDLGNMECRLTVEETYLWPSQFRTEIRGQLIPKQEGLAINGNDDGQKFTIVQLVSGDEFKKTMNGLSVTIDDAEREQIRIGAVIRDARRLVPLLDSAKYTLASAAGENVRGRPAEVVEVRCEGIRELRLFFDQETGLLVKTFHQIPDPSTGGSEEATVETELSDYQNVQGLKMSMKQVVYVNGRETTTMTVTDAKLLESVDRNIFSLE